jgi:hypothetical protein
VVRGTTAGGRCGERCTWATSARPAESLGSPGRGSTGGDVASNATALTGYIPGELAKITPSARHEARRGPAAVGLPALRDEIIPLGPRRFRTHRSRRTSSSLPSTAPSGSRRRQSGRGGRWPGGLELTPSSELLARAQLTLVGGGQKASPGSPGVPHVGEGPCRTSRSWEVSVRRGGDGRSATGCS